MNYVYKRVSTERQDNRRQDQAFQGLKVDAVFEDKITGKNKDRPELNKLRLAVKRGDQIYCESISRLGRNVDDLRALVDEFKFQGVTVHFVKEGFNTSPDNNMSTFMLTILGAVAEMERELTVERVREGVSKAKKYGTRSGKPIGRPVRELPSGFGRYYARWKAGDFTAVEFARLLEVSRGTVYNYINYYEQEVCR